MKYDGLTASACLLLLGACTTYPAQTTSNTEIETTTVAEEEVASADAAAVIDEEVEESLDVVICKRTIITGSRFAKRVCMSRRAWLETSTRARTDVKDTQRTIRHIPRENN